MLALLSERLRTDPEGSLGRISRFLSIADFKAYSSLEKHARTYGEKISSEATDELTSIYKDDVRDLMEMLNLSESPWKNFPYG